MDLTIEQNESVLTVNGAKYSVYGLGEHQKLNGEFTLTRTGNAFPRGAKWSLVNKITGETVTTVQTDKFDDASVFSALRKIIKRFFIAKMTAEGLKADFAA